MGDNNLVIYHPSPLISSGVPKPLLEPPGVEGAKSLKLSEESVPQLLATSGEFPQDMKASRPGTIHGLENINSNQYDPLIDEGPIKGSSREGSKVRQLAYRYKEKGTSLIKKLVSFLFVQGTLYQSASNLSADVKLLGGFENLAHGESFISAGSTPIAVSVGGALSAIGVVCVGTQLAADVTQVYKGHQRVKAHGLAAEAHQLAIESGNSAEIKAAISEVNALQAGKVLGQEMKASGKKSFAMTSSWAVTYGLDVTTSSISIASLASTTVANMHVLSAFSTGLSLLNTSICTPLFAYGLYSNLVSSSEHARTSEVAESLIEKYGVGTEQENPELEAVANLVKERQAYKGKRFLAGMTVMKMLAGITGACGTLISIGAAAGTTAATIAGIVSPIGWAIGGLATAGLVGYGLYKAGRYLQRRSQINDLHALAAHTMPEKGDLELPKLSSKQSAWLQGERERIRTDLRSRSGQLPLWQEVDAVLHAQVLDKLIKVDTVYAARVLLYGFKEDMDAYLKSHPHTRIEDIGRGNMAKIGSTAEFLCQFGNFSEETLISLYHSEPERDKDAVKLIQKRLNLG